VGDGEGESYVLSVTPLTSGEGERLSQAAQANSSAGLALKAVGQAYRIKIIDSVTGEAVEQLTSPIELEMAYGEGTQAGELVGIYRYQDGEFSFVGAAQEPSGQTVRAKTVKGGIFTLLEYHRQFADMAGHQAEEAVRRLSARPIVRGVNDSDFVPERQVTRAEWGVLLGRTLELEQSHKFKGFFDVPPNAWYVSPVGGLVEAGIIQGASSGAFGPDQPVTWIEAGVTLGRILERQGLGGQSGGSEPQELPGLDQVPLWAKKDMALAVNSGLIDLDELNLLEPVSRAEAAKVVSRLLESIE
jgi:hypothetical protein